VKAQASRTASVSAVRPKSGTTVQKIGHNTHTGTGQSPYSNYANIRKVCVTWLYDRCPAAVRASRNHLTNVVLAAEPVVVHPGDVRHAGVIFGSSRSSPGRTLRKNLSGTDAPLVGRRHDHSGQRHATQKLYIPIYRIYLIDSA
jgi:hypothetical protein